MPGFRITVHLHHFYCDHRSSCRIFVDDHLDTINDLKKHVAALFRIDNSFYFVSSNNIYIPYSESVEVLREDEVLVAIPCSAKFESSEYEYVPCVGPSNQTNRRCAARSNPHLMKSKRKLQACNDSVNLEKHKETNTPVRGKKKKKEKVKNREEAAGRDKRKLQKTLNTCSDSEEQTDEDVKEKKKKENVVDKGDKNKFKQHYSDRKVINVTPLEISTKPNVVKILRVDHLNDQPEKPVEPAGPSEPSPPADNIEKPSSLLNGVLKLLTNDSLEMSCSNSIASQSELESVVTETTIDEITTEFGEPTSKKRKRKRYRKKKSKQTEMPPVEAPVSFPAPAFIPKTKPAIHIKFDANGSNEVEEDKEEPPVAPTVVAADVITDDVAKNSNENEMINLNLDLASLKECILNRSVMPKDRQPREGDIIAFKVMVLSESYTPEITDYIVAKVLQYMSFSNTVNIRILEGGEQWSTPNGKFSVEETSEQSDHERSVLWDELIEPRLLFP